MPSGDNELWDRGRPRQPGDNAGSIARQTVCKWRSHRERKFVVLCRSLSPTTVIRPLKTQHSTSLSIYRGCFISIQMPPRSHPNGPATQ
jgi:hypothetical protein